MAFERTEIMMGNCSIASSGAFKAAVMEAAFSGIIELDPSGYITEINDRAILMLNFRNKQVIGERLIDVFPLVDKHMLDDVLQNGESLSNYMVKDRKDRFLINVEPIADSGSLFGAVILIQKLPDMAADSMRKRKEGLSVHHFFSGFYYTSEKFHRAIKNAILASYTDAPILLVGEDGTEIPEMAECIHNESKRNKNGFASIECNAIEAEKISQLLFSGMMPDSSSGNPSKSIDGGTLFINHIDRLPSAIQYRIALLIMGKHTNEKDFCIAQTDVRIIASSKEDLKKLVREGQFREDLYYALSAITIRVPSLRERMEDLEDMAYLFIKKYSIMYSKPVKLTKGAYDCLHEYSWPRNVRELDYFCQRIVLNADKRSVNEAFVRKHLQEIAAAHMYDSGSAAAGHGIENIRAAEIIDALRRNGGNKSKTANELGISKATLWRHIQKYGITAEYK